MHVLAWSSSLTQDTEDAQAVRVGFPRGCQKWLVKAALFQSADVLSVRYVISPRSKDIISALESAVMKHSGTSYQ
jgi:hypothetical protein